MRILVLFIAIVAVATGALRQKRQFIPLTGRALFPRSQWARYNKYHNIYDNYFYGVRIQNNGIYSRNTFTIASVNSPLHTHYIFVETEVINHKYRYTT
ncbi:hypothetical protein OSTOST_00616 [Ostertagia ostertagi]